MGELWCSVLFLLTVLLSNTIQVITGFAGAMLAMPVSIRLIGLEPAKAILNIVSAVCGMVGDRLVSKMSSEHFLLLTYVLLPASGLLVLL